VQVGQYPVHSVQLCGVVYCALFSTVTSRGMCTGVTTARASEMGQLLQAAAPRKNSTKKMHAARVTAANTAHMDGCVHSAFWTGAARRCAALMHMAHPVFATRNITQALCCLRVTGSHVLNE
jgi:hypothetical protein